MNIHEKEKPLIILFECNGAKDCSNKKGCYKNGGECHLTPNINYALNFKFDEDSGYYIESRSSNK